MLTDLREKSQSFLVYILFGILIFVFIFFFGPQADGCQPNAPTPRAVTGWAASVNGEDISVKEVNLSVYRQKQFDQSFPDEAAAIARLSREIVVQLTEQAILEQQAQRMGMAVSESELTSYIVSTKNLPDRWLFRDRKGRIDVKDFRSILSGRLGVSPEVYRRAKRRELIVRRYMDFLVSSVKVSDAEIKSEFEKRSRSWSLEYVKFDPAVFAIKIPAPTHEAVTDYAQKNAEKIKADYQKNKSTYQREKEVKVSRILVRKPKDKADVAGIAKAKKKAADLLAKAKGANAGFGALAKASSEGWFKSRGTGGDMGWQTAKRPGYAVFKALEKNAISELQEEDGWFYFVKATDVRDPINKSLADVTNELARAAIINTKAQAAARSDAEARLALAKKSDSLSKPVPAAKPPIEGGAVPAEGETPKALPSDVQTTGPILQGRGDWAQIAGIGRSVELASALPALTEKAPLIDSVIEVDDSFYVARLKERIEPKTEDLAKQRDELKSGLMRRRAFELFGNWNQVLFGFTAGRQSAKRGALLANLANGAAIKINEQAFQVRAPSRPQQQPSSQPTAK
jgi:peptidyl-prolyl cis-trans isomerase D